MGSSDHRIPRATRTLLAFFILGYIALLFSISVLKYRSFSYNTFDLAVNAQCVWNLVHGSLESSILGVPFLGHHSVFIFFLIAPFYAILPSPLTLLFLQTVVLASGAIPLFFIAEGLAGPIFGLFLAVCYLCNPGLVYLNLFEFHPVAFATAWLLWAIWSWQRRRWKSFYLWIFLSFMCQENVALLGATLGLYSLCFRERRKAGAVLLALSLGWFSFLVFWFMPRLHQGRINFLMIYRHLGDSLPEIVWYLFSHPLEILQMIFAKRHWLYYVQLLGPLGFLPLLGPDVLILSGPILLQHLLSLRVVERIVYYHYQALLIPFLFWASALAAGRLTRRRTQRVSVSLGLFIFICTVASNLLFGAPRNLPTRGPELVSQTDLNRLRREWIQHIPEDASVIASLPILAHLSNRRFLYSFGHVYSGTYTLGRQPYHIEEDVQVAFLDFDDRLVFHLFKRPGSQERMERFFSEKGLLPSRWVENLALYEKNPVSPSYEVLSDAEYKEAMVTLGPIELLYVKAQREEGREGEILAFEFYWRLKGSPQGKDYRVLYGYRNEEGKVFHRKVRPFCAGLYPPGRWRRGEVVVERHGLLLPTSLPSGDYSLFVGLYDAENKEDVEGVMPREPSARHEFQVVSFQVK